MYFGEVYRRDLDRAGGHLSDIEGVVEEAAVAFELNIQLSLRPGLGAAPAETPVRNG